MQEMEKIFDIHPCGLEDLAAVRGLEEEVLAALERPDLLRRNTEEMWQACLQPPHCCIGAWVEEILVAIAVLYVPHTDDQEDLSRLLTHKTVEGCRSANFKICIVRPQWRGHGLQVTLGRQLEEEALRMGFGLLCATASPHNAASVKSLERLGYQRDCTLMKYGFERILFYKEMANSW